MNSEKKIKERIVKESTRQRKSKLYFLGYHKEWGMIVTDIISRPLAVLLAKTPITANQISFISMIFGLIGACFLALGGYKNILVGAIMAFIYNVLDMCDGMVAREKQQSSLFGQWLDGVIGFFMFQILIIALAIGLRNYLALVLGMLAAISYPTQYAIIYYYRAEIVPHKEEISVKSKFKWLKNVYGLSFFYIFLLVAAVMNKPLSVLIFWATLGNLYWIVIIMLQYFEVKKLKQKKGKPKYKQQGVVLK